jgi:hypothetical protein
MLLDIWTQFAEKFEGKKTRLSTWRIVEGQYYASTRKLVDTSEEQAILEGMIEKAKPHLPHATQHLHFLLSTPFRYSPLLNGSRFGTKKERSIFYCSKEPTTTFAELAYYRLFFLNGSTGDFGLVELSHTLFCCKIRSERFIDLTQPPFMQAESILSSPHSYSETQALGVQMRNKNIDVFAFISARDPQKGINYGVFDPKAFYPPQPTHFEHWKSFSTKDRIEIKKDDVFPTAAVHTFHHSDFVVNGALPAPAL